MRCECFGAHKASGGGATLKIKKSGSKSAYSGSIKLPWAGKWRLVAVFPGNSAYAQSGSKYKDVKVK